MKRPEVEKYEAMAKATRGCCVRAEGDVDAIAWLTSAVRITDDLCAYGLARWPEWWTTYPQCTEEW